MQIQAEKQPGLERIVFKAAETLRPLEDHADLEVFPRRWPLGPGKGRSVWGSGFRVQGSGFRV